MCGLQTKDSQWKTKNGVVGGGCERVGRRSVRHDGVKTEEVERSYQEKRAGYSLRCAPHQPTASLSTSLPPTAPAQSLRFGLFKLLSIGIKS